MGIQAGTRIKILFLVLLLPVFVTNQTARAQRIFINEVMSSNRGSILDEDFTSSDWIEIYNAMDYPASLSSFALSDDPDSIGLWSFPDTMLAAHEYMVIYASGKNRVVAGLPLHTSFRIRSSGEKLYLSNNGTILQTTPETCTGFDTSFGLFPDGGDHYTEYHHPTPGAPNTLQKQWDQVSFSSPGGLYASSFKLQITPANPSNRIFFTTNGNLPTHESIPLHGPLQLSDSLYSKAGIGKIQISPVKLHYPAPDNVTKAIVIRAASFDEDNNRVSDIVTESYLIADLGSDHGNLPVVSITATYHDLFDYIEGILVPGLTWQPHDPDWTGNYYQKGKQWEIPVNVEFYDPHTGMGYNQQAGLRTHGGNCRRLPQKGLKLYARDQYGSETFDFAFFPNQDIDQYHRLVLRPFYSSWSQAGFEDQLAVSIARKLNLDAPASRPVVLYLNGEYWGIYFLQESSDQHFITDHYGIEADSVVIAGNWYAYPEAGDPSDFLNLFDFVTNNDLTLDKNYTRIREWMDLESFIDFQLYDIFISNLDWPANNMKCWQHPVTGQWRWFFFDGDAGFADQDYRGFEIAMSTYDPDSPTHIQATLFLTRLLENPDIYQLFMDRLNFLINGSLNYSGFKSAYQSCVESLSGEINRQIARFAFPVDFSTWMQKVDNIYNFLIERPCVISKQVKTLFNQEIGNSVCNSPVEEVHEVGIFPNPNNGNFTCNLYSDRSVLSQFTIVTMRGQVVCKWQSLITEGFNEIHLNQPGLPDGLLCLVINTGQQVTSLRFVKCW